MSDWARWACIWSSPTMRWRYSDTCVALFWPAQHALYHSMWSKTADTIRWRTGRRINPRFQRQWESIVACFCSFFDPKAEEDTETWAKLKLIVAWRPVNTGTSAVFAVFGGKIPRTPCVLDSKEQQDPAKPDGDGRKQNVEADVQSELNTREHKWIEFHWKSWQGG